MNAKAEKFLAFYYGRTSVYFERAAPGLGVSQRDLALGMAELLRTSEGGEELGDLLDLPALSRNSTKPGLQGEVLPKSQIHVRSRGDVRKEASPLRQSCAICGYVWHSHKAKGPHYCPECKSAHWRGGPEAERVRLARAGSASQKGYSYKGKHWTQSAEGKARMREIQAARYAKAPAKRGRGFPKGGVHWTQTPEGRERQRAKMKKFWREGRFKKPSATTGQKPKVAASSPEADFLDTSKDLTKG